MKILGVIPVRYASSRFEGKPLKNIEGYPMIEWVYERAKNACIDAIAVATDDERIYQTVKNFGGNVLMTSKNHENGTSRIIEVINSPEYDEFDFVINIQGDEPLIDVDSINTLAQAYRSEKCQIVTLKKEIIERSDIENPNIVKVVTDFNDYALYFSRSPIPYERNKKETIGEFKYYKHIGIYGYTAEFLRNLKKLKGGILERLESLEQLKFMENGYRIKVLKTEANVIGVDTPEDLMKAVKYIRENSIKLKWQTVNGKT